MLARTASPHAPARTEPCIIAPVARIIGPLLTYSPGPGEMTRRTGTQTRSQMP